MKEDAYLESTMTDTPASGKTLSQLFKKWFMRQFWRVQQSQMIISMIFWATTLTLLIFARIEHRWDATDEWNGLPISYVVMITLFAAVLIGVLVVGWLYDRIFELWKEHQNVGIERNPFATYQLTPRDAMILGYLSTILRQMNPDDKSIIEQCNWMDKWVSTTPDLEVFRRMVTELDKILEEPVPEFHFLPEGAVEKARNFAKSED